MVRRVRRRSQAVLRGIAGAERPPTEEATVLTCQPAAMRHEASKPRRSPPCEGTTGGYGQGRPRSDGSHHRGAQARRSCRARALAAGPSSHRRPPRLGGHPTRIGSARDAHSAALRGRRAQVGRHEFRAGRIRPRHRPRLQERPGGRRRPAPPSTSGGRRRRICNRSIVPRSLEARVFGLRSGRAVSNRIALAAKAAGSIRLLSRGIRRRSGFARGPGGLRGGNSLPSKFVRKPAFGRSPGRGAAICVLGGVPRPPSRRCIPMLGNSSAIWDGPATGRADCSPKNTCCLDPERSPVRASSGEGNASAKPRGQGASSTLAAGGGEQDRRSARRALACVLAGIENCTHPGIENGTVRVGAGGSLE